MNRVANQLILCLAALCIFVKPHNGSHLSYQAADYQIGHALSATALIERSKGTGYYQTADDDPQSWRASLKSPEWWLVFLGFPSLGIVLWQAIATANSARSMVKYTHAFIESQRPIIVCDPHEHPFQDLASAVPRMRLALSNHGSTTAFHCAHESWIEFIPHETGEGFEFDRNFTFSASASHFTSENPFSLYPDHKPVIINIPAGKDLSEAEKLAIRRGKLLVCVRLRLTFSDTFNPKRFSDFGFWVMYEGMGYLAKYQDSN